MIALDTNVLVYARREESPFHEQARDILVSLAEGTEPWAIPWPCVYEFLRVVTHPRVFNPPTPIEEALDDLDGLFDSPTLVLLGEGPSHRAHLLRMARAGRASGNLAHDAHIAALAIEHGISELWTTDVDFRRFSGLRTRNPFESRVGEGKASYGAGRTRSPRRSVRVSS